MRRLPVWIAIILLAAACATQETAQDDAATEPDEDIEETERVEEAAPEWYERTVRSDRDSTSFYGFSHAVASTESEAQDLSEEMALSNLRFEIDRFAEDLRRDLEEEEGEDPFGTSRFIIDLRNVIQDLSFDDVEMEHYSHDDNGVVDVYTRVKTDISLIAETLSSEISDERFREALAGYTE